MHQQLRVHIVTYLLTIAWVLLAIFCELFFQVPALALLGFVFVYERTHISAFFTMILATACDVLLLYPLGTTTFFFAGIEWIKSMTFFKRTPLVYALSSSSLYLLFQLWQRHGALTFIDGLLYCVFLYIVWRGNRLRAISKSIL